MKMGTVIVLAACLLGIIVLIAIAVLKALFNLLSWIEEKISERGLGGWVLLFLVLEIIIFLLNEFVFGKLNKSILLCALL